MIELTKEERRTVRDFRKVCEALHRVEKAGEQMCIQMRAIVLAFRKGKFGKTKDSNAIA